MDIDIKKVFTIVFYASEDEADIVAKMLIILYCFNVDEYKKNQFELFDQLMIAVTEDLRKYMIEEDKYKALSQHAEDIIDYVSDDAEKFIDDIYQMFAKHRGRAIVYDTIIKDYKNKREN